MMKSSLFKSALLGDVLKFFNGKSIKPGGDGQYPVYGSNGLIGRSDEYTHQNGLIIGRVGACGAIRYCQTHFWASDNTIVGQPKDISFDIRYIYYLLRELNLNRYAEGSAQPLLTQTVLRQVPTTIPPLPTQQKIAAILSVLDDKIELNQQMNETLAAMAQAIFKSWFVDFDPVRAKMQGRMPAGMDAATATLFPSAFQDSSLGKIPEGWKVGTIGEVAKNVRQSVKASEIDADEFYIGLEHMPRLVLRSLNGKQPPKLAVTSIASEKVRSFLGNFDLTFTRSVLHRLKGFAQLTF